MSSAQKRMFDEKSYVRLGKVVPGEVLSVYFEYARNYVRVSDYFEIDQNTRSLGRYSDALGEILLTRLLPIVEALVGRKLFPTYSYLRFYTPDSLLEKHTDRPSCEYSLTLTIGRESSQDSWPILLESEGRTECVDLGVGDALLFQGTKLPHWREPLADGNWLQLFMHYVDANGPHATRKYDGRKSVGPWVRRGL